MMIVFFKEARFRIVSYFWNEIPNKPISLHLSYLKQWQNIAD